MRFPVLMTLTLLAATPSLAQEKQLIRPDRDVAVDYRSGGASVVTMRFTPRTQKIRMDGFAGQGFMLVDTGTAKMTMVYPEKKGFIEGPADPDMMALFQPTGATFRKSGTDTVAGIACTTYDVSTPGHSNQLCLTADGVLLRSRALDQHHAQDLEAVKVSFAAQSDSLFEVPAGFTQPKPGDTERRRMFLDMGPPEGPQGSYWGRSSGR
jgi:hypothetical protein